LPFHRSSSGSRMMEVAHPLIFRAFRSPHPTTVDLIFRSLVYVHAMCQSHALPTYIGMLGFAAYMEERTARRGRQGCALKPNG